MNSPEKILKALANRRRLAIIKFLHKAGRASVGDIASEIKLSFTATSKHLRILFAADIVEQQQVSLTVLYNLVVPHSELVKSVLKLL